MAEQPASASPRRTRCVTFTLDAEVYGIDVVQVREALREIEAAPVPGAPEYVTGIIDLRGKLLSVVDARRRFGLPPVESTPRAGNRESARYVDGVVSRGDEFLILVDRDKLPSEAEPGDVANL